MPPRTADTPRFRSRSLTAGLALLALAIGCITTASRAAEVKITLAGDSTVTDAGGWAPGFRAAWTPDVVCTNLAHSGASSKSFRDIGDWRKVLETRANYV